MKQEQKLKIYFAIAVAAIIGVAFFALIGTNQDNRSGAPLYSKAGKLTDDELAQLPSAAPETKISKDSPLGKAKEINTDAIAWLQIPNTEIDNAVMQTSDNEYYLSRDESGNKSQWGSFFADYYANLTSPDSLIQNTVLYGHTENKDNPNGQRFSQLFKFTDLDFAKDNRNIYLTVGESKLTFEVFAVFYSDTDFYYIDPSPSEESFASFMREVNARNEYVFEGVDVTEQDRLLTLSGCSHKYDVNKTDNHRIVVMAKLVKDGTATPVTIQQNPSPKRPQQ